MTMKLTALAAAMGFVMSAGAMAGNTATQDVTYVVTAINEITVTGTPSLTVNAATAGSEPDAATWETGAWAVTTNGTGKKLTAVITTGENMPDGVTLSISAVAPTGGTGGTYKQVSIVAADLVTVITKVAEEGLNLSYKLEALVTAGVVDSAEKTITFTLADAT